MIRYSEAVRNAGLDARIETIGPSPTLRIFADDGEDELVVIRLPKVWMTKAVLGMVHKVGEWAGIAENDGEATRFEISDSNDVKHISGDIPADMSLDNRKIEKLQTVLVGVYVISAGNA
jgi:hypothetical protein